MHRLINYKNILGTGFSFPWRHRCVTHLYGILLLSFFFNHKGIKFFYCLVFFVFFWETSFSQRQDINLNSNWITSINNKDWKTINIGMTTMVTEDYYMATCMAMWYIKK
jgi:hypothetical protein